MYCTKCGKKLEANQMFCPFCGTKRYINKRESNEQRKNDADNAMRAASLIIKAYKLLCFTSISISLLWSLIILNDLKDFTGIFIFVEFACIFMSAFILSLKKAYTYDAAKAVMLFLALTACEVIFLALNTENITASIVVEFVFGIFIAAMYFLIKKLVRAMLEENNITLQDKKYTYRFSDADHQLYCSQIKSVGINTSNGKWSSSDLFGEKTFVCNHCGKTIAYESDFTPDQP